MGREDTRRYRGRHPDRAAEDKRRSAARAAAARTVASRHPAEYEAEIQAECARRGLARYAEPLDPMDDARMAAYQ